MTVKEIQDKLPEAHVYMLNTEARYLILCDRRDISMDVLRQLSNHITAEGLSVTVLLVPDTAESIRILELIP